MIFKGKTGSSNSSILYKCISLLSQRLVKVCRSHLTSAFFDSNSTSWHWFLVLSLSLVRSSVHLHTQLLTICFIWNMGERYSQYKNNSKITELLITLYIKELGEKNQRKCKDTKNSLRGTRLCLKKQVSFKEAEMDAVCLCILLVLFTGRIPRTLSGLCKVLKSVCGHWKRQKTENCIVLQLNMLESKNHWRTIPQTQIGCKSKNVYSTEFPACRGLPIREWRQLVSL